MDESNELNDILIELLNRYEEQLISARAYRQFLAELKPSITGPELHSGRLYAQPQFAQVFEQAEKSIRSGKPLAETLRTLLKQLPSEVLP